MWNFGITVIAIEVLSTLAAAAADVPVRLAAGSGAAQPQQPQAWLSPSGIIDVVYATGNQIQTCTSRDRGTSFQAGSAAISCPNLSAGMRRGPRVVRTAAGLLVSAIGGQTGKGRDGNLWTWLSKDDGQTWTPPVCVNDAPDSAREGLHGMTATADGDIWCVWLDLRSLHTEIYAACSKDHGTTWRNNIRVYTSPDGNVCECCHPSIIETDQGLIVMFRNSLAGARDMYMIRLGNDQVVSPAHKIGNGTWHLNACPMDGGMLAGSGSHRITTVWQRDGRVFATLGKEDAERDLGVGQQPWVAAAGKGPVFVWTTTRNGPLMVQTNLAKAPRQLSLNGRYPVVTSHPLQDFAVVCWEEQQAATNTIFVETLEKYSW